MVHRDGVVEGQDMTETGIGDRVPAPRVEPLLSNRLFMAPQLVGDRLFFISNLGGRFSLYAMDRTGSVPEPLLPPDIALQNPELIDGHSFCVFPRESTIVVMIDNDGDENYVPYAIPIDGGLPAEMFGGRFAGCRSHLLECNVETGRFYLNVESRSEAMRSALVCDLQTGDVAEVAKSTWGAYVVTASEDGSRLVLAEGYTAGDTVLFLLEPATGASRTILGTPISEQPDRS
jgi:hypothetical protein